MAAENHHHYSNPYNKSKEVSTMIKQGFISDPFLSPNSRPQHHSLSRVPLSPSHHSLSSPPRSSSSSDPTTPTRPTLFEMMSEEQTRESRQSVEARQKVHEKVSRVLETAPFRDPGKWGGFGDVKLAISGRDGFRVSMDVHRQVLADRSRFFAEKLRRGDGGGAGAAAAAVSVEICDCDDVEVYVETVVLMYCDDMKRRLVGEEVSKVLGLLKVMLLGLCFIWFTSVIVKGSVEFNPDYNPYRPLWIV